jgi:hypothetical protein
MKDMRQPHHARKQCLEKDLAGRYQSAHELALALARLPGSAAAAAPRWRWLIAGDPEPDLAPERTLHSLHSKTIR